MRKSLFCLLSFLFLVYTATAQNLIVNGDFSDGNSGFTSDYNFKSTLRTETWPFSDLGANEYQITTHAGNSHQAWAAYNPGPQSGTQFFIANPPADTDKSAWMQTIAPESIISSTPSEPVYYRFQAYIASVYPVNRPILAFEISFNGLGNWQQLTTSVELVTDGAWVLTYKDLFFTEAPTSISFRLRNAQPTDAGNDLAIDSIYFGLSADAPAYDANDTPIDSFGAVAIPEPITFALVFGALALVAAFLRHRCKP